MKPQEVTVVDVGPKAKKVFLSDRVKMYLFVGVFALCAAFQTYIQYHTNILARRAATEAEEVKKTLEESTKLTVSEIKNLADKLEK